jgi:hypothetical protein
MTQAWPWLALLGLGAFHGVNPAMGWLFAVALGLQEKRGGAVLRALPPIALGHAAAVGVVLVAAALAGLLVPLEVLRVGSGAILIALGLYRLWRHRHPRAGGMQVGFRDLTAWSFLMASAHGAGLMVLPFVLPEPAMIAAASHQHAGQTGGVHSGLVATDATAVAIHTTAYLVVMTLVAWVVYRRLGLRLLRTAWVNTDWLWAAALVLAGLTLVLA